MTGGILAQESGLMSSSLLYTGAALLCSAVWSHPGWFFDRKPTLEDVNSALIGTLRSQLDRCGPEALRLSPCPVCVSGFAEETLWKALIVGLLFGIVLSILCTGLWLHLRGLGSFGFQQLDSQETLALVDNAPEDSPAFSGLRWSPTSCSSARLLRRG